MFTFSQVTVAGASRPRLADVSCEIPGHGITVVLGPSGAGKSTLLRLCNRLDVADAGTVSFRGAPVTSIDPLELRRRVGIVFQRPVLLGGTVRDNLVVAAPDAGSTRQTEVLERCGLEPGLLHRAVDTLSGGEGQRVCLARTLLTDPEALLMDEPTSSVDPGGRMGLERLARRLAGDGVPMVWVTHDLHQMRRLADHVVMLIGGMVAFTGSPAQLGATDHPGVLDFLREDDDER